MEPRLPGASTWSLSGACTARSLCVSSVQAVGESALPHAHTHTHTRTATTGRYLPPGYLCLYNLAPSLKVNGHLCFSMLLYLCLDEERLPLDSCFLSVLQSHLKKQTPKPRESPSESKSIDVQESPRLRRPVGTEALVFILREIPITK